MSSVTDSSMAERNFLLVAAVSEAAAPRFAGGIAAGAQGSARAAAVATD